MLKMPFTFAQPEWLGEVSSTNDFLKRRAADGSVFSGNVIAARRQTKGRGRMDSEWLSSPDGDLTFSFYWQGEPNSLALGSLPMACALGVRDFLANPPIKTLSQCKWPNDVLIGDDKICGILTEGGVAKTGNFGLVIGIGVNLRKLPGRDDRIGRKTASIEELAGTEFVPEALLPELLARLERRINQWQTGGFAAIRADLISQLWGMGRTIAVKTAQGRMSGVVAGLGDNGELLLRDPTGKLFAVASVSAIENGWDNTSL